MCLHCWWGNWGRKVRLDLAAYWLLIPILAMGFAGAPADAATYRYKDNAPPAKMLLDMMEVMGVVERVPDGSYGAGTRWPVTPLWGLSPWSAAVGGGGLYPWMAAMTLAGSQPWAGRSGWWNGMPAFPGNLAAGQAASGPLWSADAVERMLAPQAWDSASGSGRLTPRYRRLPAALEGLWTDGAGRMLLLSGGRFAWRDVNGKLNAGIYHFDNNVLTTFVPGYDLRVRYSVRVTGDRLVAVSESGLRYNFYRVR